MADTTLGDVLKQQAPELVEKVEQAKKHVVIEATRKDIKEYYKQYKIPNFNLISAIRVERGRNKALGYLVRFFGRRYVTPETLRESLKRYTILIDRRYHSILKPGMIVGAEIIKFLKKDVEDKEYLVPIVRPVALPEKFVRLSLEDGKILLQRIVKLGPESLYIEPLFIVDSPSSQ